MKKTIFTLIFVTISLFGEEESCSKNLLEAFDFKMITSKERSGSTPALSFKCDSKGSLIGYESDELEDKYKLKLYGTLADKKMFNNEPLGIDLHYGLKYSPWDTKAVDIIDMDLFSSAKRLQQSGYYDYSIGTAFLFQFKRKIKERYLLPILKLSYSFNKGEINNLENYYSTLNPYLFWNFSLKSIKSEIELSIDYKKRYSLDNNLAKNGFDDAFRAKLRYDYLWEKKFKEYGFEVYKLFWSVKEGKEELKSENDTNINVGIKLKLLN